MINRRTSRKGKEMISHFAAGTHGCIVGGKPMLLILKFRQIRSGDDEGKILYKFPGGMGENQEVPVNTAVRELVDEVGGEGFKISSINEFHRKGNPNGHLKLFYFFQHEGAFRKDEKMDGNSLLLDVYYEDVRSIHHNPDFAWAHRSALRAAILSLAQEHAEFAYAADELGIDSAWEVRQAAR